MANYSEFTLAEELLLLALDDESGELRGYPRFLLAGAAVMELTLRGLICPIPPYSPEWLPALLRIGSHEQYLIPGIDDAETLYREQYQNTPTFVWQVLVDNNSDISLPPLESQIWSNVEAETRRAAEPSVFNLRSVVDYKLATNEGLFQLGLTRLLERGILYKAEKRSLLRPHHIAYPTEKRDVKRELRDSILGWLLRKRATVRNINAESDFQQQAERSRMLGWLAGECGLLPYLVSRNDRGIAEWRVAEAARLSTDPHSAISCVYYASLSP